MVKTLNEKLVVGGVFNRWGLSPQEVDTRLLLEIYEGVFALSGGDVDWERTWVRAPMDDLNDRSIADCIASGDLSQAKQFVDFVNGRS